MWCAYCAKEFPSACTCPDKRRRLSELMQENGLAFLMCTGCMLHADLCECDEPEPKRELMTRRAS
jgi:hypothetical protein